MIYENFINCYLPYEKLKTVFEKSYLYKSFNELKNFDYQKVKNSSNIINLTNLFIDKIGGEKCLNQEDINNFYFNWFNFFNSKADEYLVDADKVLRDICIVRESQKYKGKKVEEILSHIYWNYIYKN